jgi:hypothetical protein
MSNPRMYKGKDVEMLMSVSTLLETAIANQDFLVLKRSIWAPPFFDNLKNRVDTIFKTHLGIDSAKDMRQSTLALLGIQKNAIKDLALVKVQVEEDFKKDKPRQTEILKQLGFTAHLKDVQNKDQEALITLLYMFKNNLPGLRAEIEAKGTDKNSLDTIVAYADTLKNANVSQETFKSSKKTITADALADFNGIYSDVISVCKIAAKLFADKPHLKEQFSYSKVLKALNNKPGGDDAPPPTA